MAPSQDADYGSVWCPTQVSAAGRPIVTTLTYVRPWDGPGSTMWRGVTRRRTTAAGRCNRWAWAPGYAVRERPVWPRPWSAFIGGAGLSVSIAAGSAPVGCNRPRRGSAINRGTTRTTPQCHAHEPSRRRKPSALGAGQGRRVALTEI